MKKVHIIGCIHLMGRRDMNCLEAYVGTDLHSSKRLDAYMGQLLHNKLIKKIPEFPLRGHKDLEERVVKQILFLFLAFPCLLS